MKRQDNVGSELVEVRVLVPASRETEFYRWFADWRDGINIGIPDAGDEQDRGLDLDAATNWWRILTKNERALWSLWLDAAPELVAADQIVEGLQLKSSRAIPGILSWPTRKARKVGFRALWTFDENDGAPLYGIDDPEYAELLRHAREAARR